MLAMRIAVCLAASIVGFGTAWYLSRRSKNMLGLSLGLGLIIGFVVFGHRLLPSLWALRWEEFAYGSVGGPALLGICIPIVGMQASNAISHRLVRIAVITLVACALFQQVWLAALDSLFAVPQLTRLKTKFTPTKVCLQTTEYTCGPAAAVTALTRLGYAADESSIALKAETGRFFGTDEFRLSRVMNQTAKGLNCHVVDFHSVDELRGLPPVIVVVNLSADVAHYIVVLNFDGNWAECADPMGGMSRRPRETLERDWTRRGVVCTRR